MHVKVVNLKWLLLCLPLMFEPQIVPKNGTFRKLSTIKLSVLIKKRKKKTRIRSVQLEASRDLNTRKTFATSVSGILKAVAASDNVHRKTS